MNCRPSVPGGDSSQAVSRPRSGRSGESWLLAATGRSGAGSCDSEIDVNIAPLRRSDCSVIYGAILSAEVSPLHVTRQMHYVGILGGTGSPWRAPDH
jgi:hypothetical protein